MQSLYSILVLLLANVSAGYLVPNPLGKYNVTLTTGPLVDYTRNDPFAATPTPRTLMLSVFQPATCDSTAAVPYMPNQTANFQGPFLEESFNITVNESPLFLEARLPVCPDNGSSCPDELTEPPILLFSPGYGIPRLYYSVLAAAVASEGFMVITIDHPEDANIITYPDGKLVYNTELNLTGEAEDNSIRAHVPIRATDASFIIDQLSNATAMAELLPQRGHRAFSIDKVGMFGHSLGGDAAVVTASQDSRLRGAINWDGTFQSMLPSSGVSQPTLLMCHGDADSTWTANWPLLNGPKLWVSVGNATHESFSDIPTLLHASGSSETFTSLLGTIAPAEMVRVLVAYSTAWMRGAFACNVGGPLLEGKEPARFPEISVFGKANY